MSTTNRFRVERNIPRWRVRKGAVLIIRWEHPVVGLQVEATGRVLVKGPTATYRALDAHEIGHI
jgi:hypothetical protein